MKIYLDVLIITNSIITLIYIQCICKITHIKISRIRLLLSSAFGGIASLIVILNNEGFIKSALITTLKLLIAGIIILIAFNIKSFKLSLKYIFLYFLMDIVFSGICLIIWQTTKSKIIYVKNYTVYFSISLLHMTVAAILIYGIISVYEWILRRKFNKAEKYKAIYSIGDYEIELKAIADSGNKLCDPFTGIPVVIFCCNELFEHFNLDNEKLFLQSGFRLTPYSTVSGKSVIPITSKGTVKILDGNNNVKNIRCCVGITRNNNQQARAIFNPCLIT
ncbi:MAG: sigma-E processing peptidase SpoIIGA [Oscillospiraceae bacterium]